MDLFQLDNPLLIIMVILLALGRYGFEKLIAVFFRLVSLKQTSVQIFVRTITLLLFNLVILKIFGLLRPHLFMVNSVRIGAVILAIGIALAVIVALLSFMAIKAGFGAGYRELADVSWVDKALTLSTFLLLVGPGEDIFFIGLLQNVLTPSLGWVAIIVYLLLFVTYHYANVLSGVESKKEFIGTLPIRLFVSSLLAVSFYLTQTLLWGMMVHNLVDTLSYAVLLWVGGKKTQAMPA